MSSPASLYMIRGIVLIDLQHKSDKIGKNRIIAKYYKKEDMHGISSDEKMQKSLENSVLERIHRSNNTNEEDIHVAGNYFYLTTRKADTLIAVVCDRNQNVIILGDFMNSLTETISKVVGKTFSLQNIYDNLEKIFVIIDDMVNDGIIIEDNPETLAMQCRLDSPNLGIEGISTETALKSAVTSVKAHITSFLHR